MSADNETIRVGIENNPDPEEIAVLYRAAGWLSAEDPVDPIRKSIVNTAAYCCARLDGRLIGMMRALSDMVSDAYLLDLIVLPEYRKQGVGREITETLAKHFRDMGVEWIVLIAAPGTESFYAKTEADAMKGYFPLRFYEPQSE